MPAVVIVGQATRLSKAEWQETKQSLAKCGFDLDAQALGKLAEIPSILIVELRDAIKAEHAQPTLFEMARNVRAVRVSRQFDETDPNMLGLFEPNFSDREHRTEERTRKLADKADRDLRRKGKGNKPYYPQPDGIDPATKCALIISVKLNWPGVRTRQAQAASQALYSAAGGDVKGTPNRTDGFWRDRLRDAREWRDTLYSRIIERAL
jgi:hypothetical protein